MQRTYEIETETRAKSALPLRGVRVLELEIGDVLTVGGQPHSIVKRLGLGKLLVRPVRETPPKGGRGEGEMGRGGDGSGNGNGGRRRGNG